MTIPYPVDRADYKLQILATLTRSNCRVGLDREYDEIANMCFALKRPVANCASLIMRLQIARTS